MKAICLYKLNHLESAIKLYKMVIKELDENQNFEYYKFFKISNQCPEDDGLFLLKENTYNDLGNIYFYAASCIFQFSDYIGIDKLLLGLQHLSNLKKIKSHYKDTETPLRTSPIDFSKHHYRNEISLDDINNLSMKLKEIIKNKKAN